MRENGPHSSDEGNPYIKTNLHTGCLRKIANQRFRRVDSRMIFVRVSHGHCSTGGGRGGGIIQTINFVDQERSSSSDSLRFSKISVDEI